MQCSTGMGRRHFLGLAILCLFAFAFRVLFLDISGYYGQIINSDAHDYLIIANNLLNGHGFAFGPGQLTAFRPFGYPFVLAVILALFGQSIFWIQMVQTLAGALVIVPTYCLAWTISGQKVAFLASLGVALHPLLIYQTATITPETIAILSMMLLLLFAIDILRRQELSWIDFSGFTLIAVTMSFLRPEFMLVPWFLALICALQYGLRSQRVQTLAFATILSTSLVIVPSVVRNWPVFGSVVPFPTIGGVTFWGANNAEVDGGWVLPSATTWLDGDPPDGMMGWSGLTEVESQRRFYATSFRWISENPHLALGLIPRKLMRSITLSFADETRSNDLPLVANVLNATFCLGALAGITLVQRGRRQYLAILLAPILGWFVKTIVFYGSARQTAPILPILCILAGIILGWAINWLLLRHTKVKSST